jgi:hypothetical protein
VAGSIGSQKFLASDAGKLIREDLEKMMSDPGYNTTSTYSPSSIENVEFADKHMKYLSQHPHVNPEHYLSNLRLMTRK